MINLEVYGLIIIIRILIWYPFVDEEYGGVLKIRDVNFWLLLLVIILYLIILIVEIRIKLSLNFLFVVLFYLIRINNLVRFFFFYEIVFILIIFSIILLGYRFERLIARFMMMFYSFMFSRPVIIMIIIFDKIFFIKSWLIYSLVINYFLIASFIVKFPIFGFHYWLPVAHVEASTVGSIVLAGVLLKLGGLGVWYLVRYLSFIVKFHWLSLAVPIVILIILILRDLKIIIAYSSVAHITIVFYVVILGTMIGKKGILIIIFYHGFISPLIFWVVGILAWWKTRSLLVIKLIIFSYIFLLVLFILFILNMSFPPFIGFIREILILKSVILIKRVLWFLVLAILLRCYYNIYLYWCFNNFIGIVFKVNFYRIDLFIFLVLILVINFYWESVSHGILWLCRFFSSGYIY